MRKRNRELSHQPVVYKFRAYLNSEFPHTLPKLVYQFVKRQQETWNALAAEQDQRWKQWQRGHPPTTVDGKPIFEKPPKEWWAEWEAWMRQRVHDSALGWEAEADIIDRFSSTLRRLGRHGGAPKLQKSLRSFSIPHRYTGGGVPLERLRGMRTERFHVDFPSVSAYWKSDRDSRRARVGKARLMVGESIVKMVVVLHRQIPSEAIIKGVRLNGWKQSPALDWETYIAITAEIPLVQPTMGSRVVGIDVGWRKEDGKLRVAVAYDGTRHDELFVFPEFTDKSLGEVSLDRQRSCQQLCDAALERCKEELKAFGIAVPPRARNRFLVRVLGDVNTPAGALPILERWRRNNDSLHRKILLLANAMAGRRDHRYREWAADIADTYDIIRVEALNLPQIYGLEASKKAKEEGDYALWMSRERRKLASVGLLISAIENAARMRGKRFEKVEAAWTTRTCSCCGGNFALEGAERDGRCNCCGRVADQDWNAAENIFANVQTPQAGEVWRPNPAKPKPVSP
jgi:hypothetical protein